MKSACGNLLSGCPIKQYKREFKSRYPKSLDNSRKATSQKSYAIRKIKTSRKYGRLLKARQRPQTPQQYRPFLAFLLAAASSRSQDPIAKNTVNI